MTAQSPWYAELHNAQLIGKCQSPWYAELHNAQLIGKCQAQEPWLWENWGEGEEEEPIDVRAERLRRLNAEAFRLIGELMRRVF